LFADLNENICAYDPYQQTLALFNKKGASTTQNAKDCFVASYVKLSDIHSFATTFNDIEQSGLDEAVEIRAHEELDLLVEEEYKIIHSPFKHGQGIACNVFAASKKKLENIFLDFLKTKSKSIDLIVPFGLLFEALYLQHILEKSKADCFFYFDKSDINVALYLDGRFIFSKQLQSSLRSLYQKYIRTTQSQISFEEFVDILQKESDKSEDARSIELMQLFGELFLSFQDSFNYTKKTFGFTQFENIYISSYLGDLPSVASVCKNYLEAPAVGIENLLTTSKELSIPIKLLALYAKSFIAHPTPKINLSIFLPKPTFFKTHLGKLSLFAASIVALFSSYLLYQGYINGNLVKQNSQLEAVIQKQQQSIKERQKAQELIASNQKEEKENIAKYTTLFEQNIDLAKSINDRGGKSELVALIWVFKALEGTQTILQKIIYNKPNWSIQIISHNEANLALTLEKLVQTNPIELISQKITHQNEPSSYLCSLELSIGR
jgi:hypothetical protein